MRRIIFALLLATTSMAAYADIPDGQHNWLDLLAHQVGSAHHFPALLLLVVVGAALVRGVLRAKTDNR